MQFISIITLALAMVTSALAAPAPQMVGSLGEAEGNAIERRQCLGSSPGEGQEGSAPDCRFMIKSQPRQMYGASVGDGDMESTLSKVSNYMSDSEPSDV